MAEKDGLVREEDCWKRLSSSCGFIPSQCTLPARATLTHCTRPMAPAAVLLTAVLAARCLSPTRAATPLTLFRRVEVSYSAVLASRRLESLPLAPGTPPAPVCSRGCGALPWCDLWCEDASAARCVLSDLVVMPGYGESSTADALACYTRRHKDLATGAAIEATPSEPKVPLRVKANLVDGFYDRWTMDQCYHSKTGEASHWLLLDFGKPATFRLVKIFVQAKGDFAMVNAARNLEVRIGTEAVSAPGDFGSYAQFGFFVGPASAFGEEIVVERPTPVRARFVSVQKINDPETVQFCHIEVY